MNGIKFLWFYLSNLIDFVFKKKKNYVDDPNMKIINDTKYIFKGNIVGKNIIIVSQEEGYDI
jgi:hypothetical protein